MWGDRPPATEVDDRRPFGEKGFTLAAMVVIMAVMAIVLAVAVESVSFQQRREKEEELIFRGNQVVESIRLFRARNGRLPIQLIELANAKPHVLRKIWKDPMTGKPDWVPVFLGQEGTPVGGPGAIGGTGATGGFGGAFAPTPTPTPAAGVPGEPGSGAQGPIIGVRSRVCEDSIKVLDGRTRYCDWKFVLDPTKFRGGLVPTGWRRTPPH